MPLVKSFQIYVCMNTHAIGCRLHIIKFPEYFLRVSFSSKVVCSKKLLTMLMLRKLISSRMKWHFPKVILAWKSVTRLGIHIILEYDELQSRTYDQQELFSCFLKFSKKNIFQYTLHSVEISWFFCHSDFTWNQFCGV